MRNAKFSKKNVQNSLKTLFLLKTIELSSVNSYNCNYRDESLLVLIMDDLGHILLALRLLLYFNKEQCFIN